MRPRPQTPILMIRFDMLLLRLWLLVEKTGAQVAQWIDAADGFDGLRVGRDALRGEDRRGRPANPPPDRRRQWPYRSSTSVSSSRSGGSLCASFCRAAVDSVGVDGSEIVAQSIVFTPVDKSVSDYSFVFFIHGS